MIYKGKDVGRFLRALKSFPYNKLVAIVAVNVASMSSPAEFVPLRITSVQVEHGLIKVTAHLEANGRPASKDMIFVLYESDHVEKIEATGEITEIHIGY